MEGDAARAELGRGAAESRSHRAGRRAWGLTIRDSFGQTETTMMVGNPLGQRVVVGSMGRRLPGYRIALVDIDGLEADHGEIAIPLNARPVGLMAGYQDDEGKLDAARGRAIIAPATSRSATPTDTSLTLAAPTTSSSRATIA